MKVMNLPSSILKPGMTVYEDIYNTSGVLILNKDTILDEWQIEKIHANSVDKVRIRLTENDSLYAVQEEEIPSIYDPSKIRAFKEKYATKVDEVTYIIKEIGRGAAVDVQTVGQISRHIIREFSTVSEVINYLHLARPLDDYTYSHSLNVSLMAIIIAKWLNLSNEEIDEIVLSMDEALTNAIQETIRKEHIYSIHYGPETRDITVMYIITMDEFEAVIIDQGKGLDLQESIKKTPDKTSSNYFDQIAKYSSKAEKGLSVRVNGQQISLKGIGAGLKIMCAFMDSITIDLIDKEKMISDTVSKVTDGTILSMHRKRRYK